jgi:V8-like Glu-specific endopeptidase
MVARWIRWLFRTPSHPPRPAPVRPSVEPLETRLALSISPVVNTTTAPFSAVVEVEVVNQGQLFSGSGVLLDSRHVLTAAHVLYDNGVLDSSVVVYPGRNGRNVLPFGVAHATALAVDPAYISGPSAGTDTYDLGVITLDQDFSAGTSSFGLLPLVPDSYFDAGGTVNVLGYPGDTFSGVNQYFSTGPVEGADSTEITWALSDVPVQHGSSGSPVYVQSGGTRTVVGIVSEVSASSGFATHITPDKYNWIISQLSSASSPASGPAASSQGPGLFDPATGMWYLHDSNSPGSPDVTPFAYGAAGWKGVTGDWDGDGTTTIGVVNPTTMTWYLRNSNAPGAPDLIPFAYGAAGWVPLAGDWNGDEVTTIGVYDPSTATWYLKNSNGPGAADITPFRYGAPGWIPVVGDWDGNGTTTIGVVDPSTMTWYLRNSNSPGAPDITPFQYGGPGWLPVVGDWDGNRTTTIGAVDPTTMLWYLKNSNGPGSPDYRPFAYGTPGQQPLAGDWKGTTGAQHNSTAHAALAGGFVAPSPVAGLDDQALLAVALSGQAVATGFAAAEPPTDPQARTASLAIPQARSASAGMGADPEQDGELFGWGDDLQVS